MTLQKAALVEGWTKHAMLAAVAGQLVSRMQGIGVKAAPSCGEGLPCSQSWGTRGCLHHAGGGWSVLVRHSEVSGM